MLSISPIYIGLLALLIIVLAYRVTTFRGAEKISLGENNSSKEMKSAIRAHGNAVENIPIAALLLLMLELNSLNPLLLHVFGVVLVLSRVMHAWGLSKRNGASPGRFYGTLFTWLLIVAMLILNILILLI
tara:strand:- start:15282 stop:15671 length:390 start_codon:yes stop_codon:yes gene_type:complete